MSFTLKNVVPWGRSLAEYKAMFQLMPQDLTQRILGVADGPASFNAEVTKQHQQVISFDPVYQFSAGEIRSRIGEAAQEISLQLKQNLQNYQWEFFRDPEHLVSVRLQTMEIFLEDFEKGKEQGRYVAGQLPDLPFETDAFDLVLSSHFLFSYSDFHSFDFHWTSILEMLRVGKEVRIFPLQKINSEPSVYLEPTMEKLKEQHYLPAVKKVAYPFQRGSSEMLVINQ
jgi:hypothetical protein